MWACIQMSKWTYKSWVDFSNTTTSTYHINITPEIKSILDRLPCIKRNNWGKQRTAHHNVNVFNSIKAPPTRIRFRLKTQLFRCGYGFRPLVSDENGHREINSLKTLSRVDFLKTPFSCFRVDGGKRNSSKTMTYQYWIQSTSAKENSGIWWFYAFRLCIKVPAHKDSWRRDMSQGHATATKPCVVHA